MTAAAAAEALTWLVTAGVDCVVDPAPRNWLAAPTVPPDPARAARSPSLPPALAGAQSAAHSAHALAAAAMDVKALHSALAAFDHPLRQPSPPQLIVGSGHALVLTDIPDEDPAVQRLTQRMLAAIGLGDANSQRLHLLPWAPPAGRPPRAPEVAAYAPFIARALTLAAPRAILAFGANAAALSGESRGIASLRGRWLAVDGVPMLATFHPRLLLNQPELKRLAWADLQAFAARLAS